MAETSRTDAELVAPMHVPTLQTGLETAATVELRADLRQTHVTVRGPALAALSDLSERKEVGRAAVQLSDNDSVVLPFTITNDFAAAVRRLGEVPRWESRASWHRFPNLPLVTPKNPRVSVEQRINDLLQLQLVMTVARAPRPADAEPEWETHRSKLAHRVSDEFDRNFDQLREHVRNYKQGAPVLSALLTSDNDELLEIGLRLVGAEPSLNARVQEELIGICRNTELSREIRLRAREQLPASARAAIDAELQAEPEA